MVLLKRLMWPRKGDEVTIYQNEKLLIEGYVIHSNDSEVTIMGHSSEAVTLTSKQLAAGIANGSLVIKKKTGRLTDK
jgi:hypothetical protein